jgi:hypothetical protein
MLTNLRSAHLAESPEIVSTGGWVVQRLVILAAAVVFGAPFVLAYVGY